MTRPEQSKPVAGSAPPQTYGTPRNLSAIATARMPIGPAVGTPVNSGESTSAAAWPGEEAKPSVAQSAVDCGACPAVTAAGGRPTRSSLPAGRAEGGPPAWDPD